jgi:hypothetical protein
MSSADNTQSGQKYARPLLETDSCLNQPERMMDTSLTQHADPESVLHIEMSLSVTKCESFPHDVQIRNVKRAGLPRAFRTAIGTNQQQSRSVQKACFHPHRLTNGPIIQCYCSTIALTPTNESSFQSQWCTSSVPPAYHTRPSQSPFRRSAPDDAQNPLDEPGR